MNKNHRLATKESSIIRQVSRSQISRIQCKFALKTNSYLQIKNHHFDLTPTTYK